jgi:hypothetical protein
MSARRMRTRIVSPLGPRLPGLILRWRGFSLFAFFNVLLLIALFILALLGVLLLGVALHIPWDAVHIRHLRNHRLEALLKRQTQNQTLALGLVDKATWMNVHTSSGG